MTVTNRVWDAVAAAHVRWSTGTPDTTGIEYPGPDAFGSTTDYTVERGVVEQPPRESQLHNLLHGPVGLWQFNGDLTDKSGSANPLTVETGAELYSPGTSPDHQANVNLLADRFRTASGAINDPIRLLGALTIEMLINPVGLAVDNNAPLNGALLLAFAENGAGNTNNTLYGIHLTTGTNEVFYYHESSNNVFQIAGLGSVIPPGKWSHLAVTRDVAGTRARTFVDGFEVDDTTLALPPTDGASSRLYMGDFVGLYRYQGGFQSLKITAAELSPSQILASARLTLPPSERP